MFYHPWDPGSHIIMKATLNPGHHRESKFPGFELIKSLRPQYTVFLDFPFFSRITIVGIFTTL